MRIFRVYILLVCFLPTATATAESLFDAGTFAGKRGALVSAEPDFTPPEKMANAPSLFIGQTEGGMFAPFPVRAAAFPTPTDVLAASRAPVQTFGGTPVARLRHLIAQAEAGRAGYDAVQHGASIRPGKRPTDMTIAEIDQWIKDTPGQPHAIGRYQFIPATLRRLVADLGVSPQTRFTPDVQDALADLLLVEAGFHRFQRGEIARADFMHNLAKIWAGLPLPNGESYYHGYAGNKATLTWTYFDGEMARIFDG
ncbi:hypothetical protein SAMN04488515_0374 [Cognatiyoonia koreensis]|uniref:Muramidase (Phage lambda lysozyme) n=1 Tax=Cognatiyoonia koreensis TaxID=364200 RepID=A0A1I0N307_9RHOB|nr:hypothetical protein [Cognatiyoonia koreensis]SEV95127.1 hypothetical protein SAMN04488515_0374 [Cognatiyoonia koreensis]